MNSILNEIRKIRKDDILRIDRTNKNRYRIVTYERNTLKTAYYFSVPIYSQSDRKLLDLTFHNYKGSCLLNGSNSTIYISDSVLLKNKHGSCRITLPSRYLTQTDKCVFYNGVKVFPTTNGIAIQADLNAQGQYRFLLNLEQGGYQIRGNNKYLAFMIEKFKPFVTVSCIGSIYKAEEIFAPAEIKYQKLTDREYEITIHSNNMLAKQILLEINCQETKLFQDTTVESKTPSQNNVFGGTAFIGNSSLFGEQWLYARPDFSIFSDLWGQTIQSANLYIPMLHQTSLQLMTVGLTTRFCSFGSNWNNKKASSQAAILSDHVSGYHKINIVNLIAQNQKLLTTSEGWIIKSAVKNNGFTSVSTGDSFYAPQILEVTFK